MPTYNTYEVVLEDGYGRELDKLTVQATNLRLALLVSEAALRRRDAGHGQTAVAATVELVGSYDDPEPEESAAVSHSLHHRHHACMVDESAGLASLPPVGGVDMAAVERLEQFSALRPAVYAEYMALHSPSHAIEGWLSGYEANGDHENAEVCRAALAIQAGWHPATTEED
jgi:hypothetical protein